MKMSDKKGVFLSLPMVSITIKTTNTMINANIGETIFIPPKLVLFQNFIFKK